MASLSFNEFIVGPNVSDIQKHFPSNRKSIPADFATDVTGWTFASEYKCLVLDTIAFDRAGDPNFTDSQVIGSFATVQMTGGDAPVVTDAANGLVDYVIPADMYTGALKPGSRTLPVVAIIDFEYTDADGFKETTRYARLMSAEADTVLGDPTAEAGYTAL